MSQENVELVRAGYRAFNERDPEALRALLHPNVEWHPTLGVLTDQRVYRGPEAVCDLVWEEIPRVLEGFRAELLNARDASEDTVIAKARFSGRSRDGGVPVEQVFFQVFRIHEGQTLWMRSFADEAEALEAAGLS
jgi:ketosteroid isomerase-like protein